MNTATPARLTRFNNDDIRYRLLIKEEIWLQRERGCDVGEVERKLDSLEGPVNREICLDFFEQLKMLPSPWTSREEPSTYEAIQSSRPSGGPRCVRRNFARALLRDKLLGGWQGRVAGCLLGKPVEGWGIDDIEVMGRLTGGYPLQDYLGAVDPPPVDQINPYFERKCLICPHKNQPEMDRP